MAVTGATVNAECEGGVGRLVLDRPEHGNALNDATVTQLCEKFDEMVAAGARLIVLMGKGRSFCTGFDLSDLEEVSEGDLLLRFVRIEMLLQKIHAAPVVTMAVAQGRTFGAGADIFASCDHRIAVDGASFVFPGVGFGLILGTTRLGARVGRDTARQILLSGARLDDRQALEAGLATRLVGEAEIETLVIEKAREAARLDPVTVEAIHRATDQHSYNADLADLTRSASRPGLRDRILRYRESIRQAKR